MINKELLSEVFNQEVRFIKYVANNTYEIHFEKPIRLKYIIINMYELAHRCKEWLLDNGYYIKISPFKVELFEKDTNSFVRDFHYPIQDKAIPYDIKRIIQCCQWILDNKEDN